MKKVISLFLICALAFSMVACGSKTAEDIDVTTGEPTTAEQTNTTEEAETTEEVREVVREAKVEDVRGGYAIQEFDAEDKIVKMTKYSDKDEVETTVEFDVNGFVTRSEGSSLGLGNTVVEYENNESGKPVKTKTFVKENSDLTLANVAEYEYFESGNTKTTTVFNGDGVKSTYFEYYDTDTMTMSKQIVFNDDGTEALTVFYNEDGSVKE